MEPVTDPHVLQQRMRECVGLVSRYLGKVIRAEVGSVAFSNALEGTEVFILAAIANKRSSKRGETSYTLSQSALGPSGPACAAGQSSAERRRTNRTSS